MHILFLILSALILALFILLLPKNEGLGSLNGGADKKTQLPFSRSQKTFFLLGLSFLITSFLIAY